MKNAIRQEAARLGFEACGFAAASPVSRAAEAQYAQWLREGKHGCMRWAENHTAMRNDPALLLPGARTIVCVALNYFPAEFQAQDAPQVAYYAYGRDYHEVLREKLTALAEFIQQMGGGEARPCVDSAPLRERYWAQRAGIGFIGRNNCLIIPGKGSFFFLGEVLTTASIAPDEPCTQTCPSSCHRCADACPTGALTVGGGAVDANKCLSCLLIENHDDALPQWAHRAAGNRVVGCDECQRCCPYNAHATPTAVADFTMTEFVKNLSYQQIDTMSNGDFRRATAHSAIARLRNIRTLRRNSSSH